MAKEKKEKARAKRPTAEKREMQNEKRRLINKAFKNKVRTAIRHFHETVEKGDKENIAGALSEVYSLMDKGIKRGIFKKNKSARVKSRLTARAHTLSKS